MTSRWWRSLATTTLLAGLGRTNFVLGTGDASITVGGIVDTITFQNGSAGGTTTIAGFGVGTDHLHLAGYGSDAVAALQEQTSSGYGGSHLTLSDGTQIVLAGVQSVTANVFV